MKGQVMLLTVLIISGTILGATTIAGLLMLYQLRQATQFGLSVQALFAADTGLEWKLYQLCQDENKAAPILSPETNSSFVVIEGFPSGRNPCREPVPNASIQSIGCAGALLPGARPGSCPRPINRAFEIVF